MVAVAQLVRALDCGSGGRAFEPRLPPQFNKGAEKLKSNFSAFFFAPVSYPQTPCSDIKKLKNQKIFHIHTPIPPKFQRFFQQAPKQALYTKTICARTSPPAQLDSSAF